MKLYGIKFREKGELKYKSALFLASDDKEFSVKLDTWLKDGLYDVDKRTISWAGGMVPLMIDSRDEPTVLYENLDELC